MTLLISVLKAIPLIILYIFIILLVLILIIVFSRLFYDVSYKLNDDKTYQAHVKVKWLFKILTVTFDYEEKQVFCIKIFGIQINGRRKKEKKPDITADKEPDIQPETKSPDTYEEAQPEEPEHTSASYEASYEETDTEEEPIEPDNKLNIKELYNKFKFIKDYPDRNIIIEKSLLLVKRVFKAIKPSGFALTGEVGFNTPDKTGKFLAAESIISAFLGFPFLVKGNFEKETLIIKLEVDGRFNFASLIFPVAAYILSRPIRKIIIEYLKG